MLKRQAGSDTPSTNGVSDLNFYDRKNVFRINSIPTELSPTTFQDALSSSFNIATDLIHVHSLSNGINGAEPKHLTATVSFDTCPPFFGGRGKLLDEVTKIVDSACSYHLKYAKGGLNYVAEITIDQHFLGFTPLTPLEIQDKSTIDCVILHGFGGNALGSFRDSKSSFTWIRDKLPQDAQCLNVVTYGYGTSFKDRNTVADFYEWSDQFREDLCNFRHRTKANDNLRPLIFIVHSLGGWIFKEALISMSNPEAHENGKTTLMCIHGALFFGVPGQGMNTTALKALAGDLPSRYTVDFLDHEIGQRLRQRQNDDFCRAYPYRDSKIIQFFELNKTPTESNDYLLLVPQSATLGRPWENGDDFKKGLSRDHKEIVKYSPTDLLDYDRVLYILQTNLIQDAHAVIQSRFHHRQESPSRITLPQITLPAALEEAYSGLLPPYLGFHAIKYRDDIVFAIEQHINSIKYTAPTIALYGEGGVGKTQTVLKFIYEKAIGGKFKRIIWINSDTTEKLSSEFDELASKFGCEGASKSNPERNRKAVLLWLQTNENWLVVFDNADKPEILSKYWPNRTRHTSIIITSRDTAIASSSLVTCPLFVPCFGIEDGASVLLSKLPTHHGKEEESARKLSQRLGGLPLAISQVAAYLSKDYLSLDQVIEEYDDLESEFVENKRADSELVGYGKNLSTAWKLTLDALSDNSRPVLDVLALLDPDSIPVDLIQIPRHQVPTIAPALFHKRNGVRNAIKELIGSLAVQISGNSWLHIHRMVQDAYRRKWDTVKWRSNFAMAVFCVARVFPKQINGQSMIGMYEQCRKYEGHVLSLERHFVVHSNDLEGSMEFAEVLAHCGWYNFERGQYDTAERVLQTAQRICDIQDSKQENLIHALVLNNLCGIHVQHQRLQQAEELLREVISIRETGLTRDNPQIQELGIVYTNYANVIRKQPDRLEEADSYFRKALDIRETCPGTTAQLRESALYDYGSWILEQGRIDEAREYLERALAQYTEADGNYTVHFATIYCIGRLQYMQGQVRKAFETHQNCLEGRAKLQGWEHILTGVSLHKVATLACELGDSQSAIQYFAKALRAFRHSSGDKGLLPRTLLAYGRTLKSQALREDNTMKLNGAESLIAEGVTLARVYKGADVPLETEADLNMLVKSTYR